ncbi:MAG TPA: hypothetical protein VHO01_01070 [Jatrophihabitans sp.]|nr:hypothetical protein [Jatrophihabitans sp.]
MSLTTDARSYADLALSQGKSALNQAGQLVAAANRRLVADAPKPAYAALGAADLVAAAVTKRVEDLPVDAVNGVTKAQQTSQTLITKAQSEATAKLAELRSRVEDGLGSVSTLPVTVKSTGESYLTAAVAAGQGYLQLAKGVYASLTDRGEAKAAQLQQDPRVNRLFGQLSDTADSVLPAARSAFDDVVTPVRTQTAPARKASTRKPAAAKAGASKPAAKTTARKPAAKVPARKAASKSAGSAQS